MTEAVLEAGSWIYKMLMTLVLAVIVVAMVGLVVRSESNTIDIQRELLFNRILYEPQGFLYIDANTVAHPAVIDIASFTQERANSVFQYAPNYGGANVSLIDGGTVTSVLINGQTYTRLATNAVANIKNGGTLVTRTYPVVIRDGNNRRNGWLRITVAMPVRA